MLAGVRLEARRVHEVAAGQGLHGGGRGEEKVVAYWAVGLQALLSTGVVGEGDGHAGVARHAVEVVDPEAAAHSA